MHKNISLADQVFEHLEADILGGKYARGESLTEMKLCADLGVSRTPIREALHRLAQEHLVEISAKGVIVLGVTDKDLVDIYDIRLAVEGMAAARAATLATEEQIAELKETVDLQEFYSAKHDAEHIRLMDSRFHKLIYDFSGSIVLHDMLTPLHTKAQKYRKTSVENSSRADASVAEHRAIFDAIVAHDADAAEQAMILHVANARNHILKGK
ncbi:MAG: GntR family transcriptional regulator [Clostridia bacterium]|nr:GntR family transcriptional regulator [Clostridia bacterium]